MPRAPRQIIVLTWAKLDGLRATGRTVLRDGYHRPEFELAPEVRAVVWANDATAANLASARAYAKREGHTVRLLADGADVLDRARELHRQEGCLLTS